MNYMKARQRKDGRWDFTCQNDGWIYPMGYCCENPYSTPISECPYMDVEDYQFAHKHHTDGHATQEEANECYRQYQLDQRLKLGVRFEGTQSKCVVCQEWTDMYAEVEFKYYDLCEKHNNRENVEQLYKASTEIWSS